MMVFISVLLAPNAPLVGPELIKYRLFVRLYPVMESTLTTLTEY